MGRISRKIHGNTLRICREISLFLFSATLSRINSFRHILYIRAIIIGVTYVRISLPRRVSGYFDLFKYDSATRFDGTSVIRSGIVKYHSFSGIISRRNSFRDSLNIRAIIIGLTYVAGRSRVFVSLKSVSKFLSYFEFHCISIWNCFASKIRFKNTTTSFCVTSVIPSGIVKYLFFPVLSRE